MVVYQVIPLFTSFDRSQVVQDFSHQQYVYTFGFMRSLVACLLIGLPKEVWIGNDGHVTHADLLHGKVKEILRENADV